MFQAGDRRQDFATHTTRSLAEGVSRDLQRVWEDCCLPVSTSTVWFVSQRHCTAMCWKQQPWAGVPVLRLLCSGIHRARASFRMEKIIPVCCAVLHCAVLPEVGLSSWDFMMKEEKEWELLTDVCACVCRYVCTLVYIYKPFNVLLCQKSMKIRE